MTTLSEAFFVDTNVLVYAADSSTTCHEACKRLLERAASGQLELVVSTRILAEFIVVMGNPNVFPNPVSKEDLFAHVDALRSACRVIGTTAAVADRFMQLLRDSGISGKRAHDVLHAATMLENGITRVYTYDNGFSGIPGIVVLTPGAAPE
jgi:predicted nucleic acid-binding protein